MSFRITAVICFVLLLVKPSFAQYRLITVSRNSVFSQTMYSNGTVSPGSTSHFFYFSVGRGPEHAVDKHAEELEGYLKVCPEAVKELKNYDKYRRRVVRSNVGKILCVIAIVPGVGMLVGGVSAEIAPLTMAGALCTFGGGAGALYYNKRADKHIEKMWECLQKSVEMYNRYIKDNKLLIEEGN